jgi:thiamine-phosphate pyrophosphorylase
MHDLRMQRFRSAGIYLVTSASLSAGRSTMSVLDAALRAGIRLVQLREKDATAGAFVELARRAREATESCGAVLIINDRLDVAMACRADGVHLGQDDFPVAAARRLAPEMIIGASSHNVNEAVAAQRAGASYVNIGPIFPTTTKQWQSEFLGVGGIDAIAPHLSIPFTVMGGIKLQHIPELVRHGARTIAVVTAITAAPDPGAAASSLLSAYGAAVSAGIRQGKTD